MIKINGIPLEFSLFPNGETKMNEGQIKQTLTLSYCNVSLKYENDSDFTKLMFVKFYLDTLGIRPHLTISYMPYSRMDRTNNGSAFTLKYIAKFINSLGFYKVLIFEPHSDVTPALINNCTTIFPSIEILKKVKKEISFNEDMDVIYFPDSGAEKRYGSLVKAKNSLVGFKHRSFETGKITSLRVFGSVPQQGFKAVMIDDLCSYGGTFILGAKELRALGASEIYLVVTHCENSIYSGDIFYSYINKIFTTDSIIRNDANIRLLSIYKLDDYGMIN